MHVAERTMTPDLARARAGVYRFLAAALDCPDEATHEWLLSPAFRQGLEILCDRFDLSCPEGELFPTERADCQSRYLACFEVGLPGPPVPLLASAYNRREPVPATVHEHILFYQRFGARLAEGNREAADHLRNELAFLVRLDELLLQGQDRESLRLARRDFLSRQVNRWVRQAADAAVDRGLPPVYVCLLELLARAADEDLHWSQEEACASEPPSHDLHSSDS
jgi:DMSO reductase family type II enzyme chaperone